MNNRVDNVLYKLSKSNFRSRFHLKQTDIVYINNKGIDTIENYAYDFIQKRLAPKVIINDGKQTPMKGHPVFIAQHATATCCRGCLEKWHNIPKGCVLSNEQIDYIVQVLMKWIENEINNKENIND